MGTIRRYCEGEGQPSWEGAELEPYAESGSPGATRRILIGPDDGAQNFSFRYFEIPAGGTSSLDRHAHDHGVYVVAGRANVVLGESTHAVGAGDIIYIEPNEPHQFVETAGDIFGFLCVVPPVVPTK